MYYGFKKGLTFFSYLQMVTNKFSPKTLSFGTAKQQRNSLMGFFVFQVSCWGGEAGQSLTTFEYLYFNNPVHKFSSTAKIRAIKCEVTDISV